MQRTVPHPNCTTGTVSHRLSQSWTASSPCCRPTWLPQTPDGCGRRCLFAAALQHSPVHPQDCCTSVQMRELGVMLIYLASDIAYCAGTISTVGADAYQCILLFAEGSLVGLCSLLQKLQCIAGILVLSPGCQCVARIDQGVHSQVAILLCHLQTEHWVIYAFSTSIGTPSSLLGGSTWWYSATACPSSCTAARLVRSSASLPSLALQLPARRELAACCNDSPRPKWAADLSSTVSCCCRASLYFACHR